MKRDLKRNAHPLIAGLGIPVAACVLFILFLFALALLLRLVLQ